MGFKVQLISIRQSAPLQPAVPNILAEALIFSNEDEDDGQSFVVVLGNPAFPRFTLHHGALVAFTRNPAYRLDFLALWTHNRNHALANP